MFLTNARSLANKMDELKLQMATNKISNDSCTLLISKTWLFSLIPNTATKLAGHTVRQDKCLR